MMQRKHVRTLARWCAALVGIVALSVAVVAAADPPSRVARLAYAEGTVSFSPSGDDQWVRAVINRPLVAGDRLWSDQGSRGEMQVTNASLRFGPLTNVSILNLDDRIGQFELAQGALQVQVRRMNSGEIVEIDTPNFAFTITRAGSYHFDVDPESGSTLVAVRSGEGEAYGEGAAYRIAAGQVLRFYGTDLRDHENLALGPPEGFERWALSRQGRYEGSVAARYVAPEVVGYEDLDQFGTWQAVADYGNVWIPRKVPSGWAPYRYGHWAWIDPWGWTWVDDAPWGFAPFHYGRWAFVREQWCWVPGPARERPVYAPALVAFVGGNNFSVAVGSGGAIGWFPLGPGEVYRPAYSVSREYFTRVNIANTRVNNTYVTNIYNNPDAANVRYAHFQRPAAITAVPQTAFVRAQPVQRAAVAVNAQVLNKAELLPLAKIAPQRTSVTGAAPAASARPPASALDKPIVAKAPPPPAPESIATRISRPGGEAGRPTPSTTTQAPQGAPPNVQAAQGQPPRRNFKVVEAAPPQPAPTTSTPNTGNRPASRAESPADKPRAEGAPSGGGPPAVPPGQQRRVEPPAQASVPPPPQAGGPPAAPPGQLRRGEPPAQATAPPSPQAGGPPGVPPGQQRRVEPPAQASAPPLPQAGGPPATPPGQQRRAEPPAQATAPSPPQAGGPQAAPPGQQRRAEPPAQATAPSPPQAGGPPAAPPGQQRRAEPPAQVATPPAVPSPEGRAEPQPGHPAPSAIQAEPRRGPPAERSVPPPQAAPIAPRTPDVAAVRPAPMPPPQAEPRRGPPAERPAPLPATPAVPRGPDAAAVRPPPQAASAPPTQPAAPQAAPPARASQQGPPPREGNPGKGRGDKGDGKEGEPKP